MPVRGDNEAMMNPAETELLQIAKDQEPPFTKDITCSPRNLARWVAMPEPSGQPGAVQSQSLGQMCCPADFTCHTQRFFQQIQVVHRRRST